MTEIERVLTNIVNLQADNLAKQIQATLDIPKIAEFCLATHKHCPICEEIKSDG